MSQAPQAARSAAVGGGQQPSANAWVAELAPVANCASVATRSGHERRADLHFELAGQPPRRKVERDAAEPGQRGRGWDRERRSRSESPSDGKAGPPCDGLALLARGVAAASRALRRLLLLPVGRSGPRDGSILET
ncbi:hypothetical protein EMIHUDRAFT_236760 [Emiliania huxleyi CCMP1516]|uniref:Uncharacterized protein n=2 Tax=Emiliania huxleyi TaxID=2903 RepID=A0A0D3JS01_EMIH1|nr:hypothetical protein EMIHUDRAFT_236760 [Emiliania huxleyi CCMP1516]EOD26286.1 hypothetical protein EMIHUDRAFT_236760 [Emiliania huxleyi CCMP1516]|eukprot:XP_005778715.1 hypothetical protein EMIHUDRAFT_236760 [Emiliania huxleyi CCMP1516]